MELLETPLGLAHIWLPSARIQQASLNAAGQTIELRNIVWQDLSLQLEALHTEFPEHPAQIQARIGPDAVSFAMELPSEFFSWRGSLDLQEEKASLENEILFRENRLSLNADFGTESWLPQRADWKADSWQIESDDFGLDIMYSDFRFNFEGFWENGAFQSTGGGTAKAQEGSELLPVNFASSVSGDLDLVSIDRFSLKAPGLNAEIKESVSFQFADKRLEGDILFDIDFDLSLLKIDSLAGILEGNLQLEANDQGKPFGRFELIGNDIAYLEHRIQSLNLEMDLDWPQLKIAQANASFNSNSNVSLSGDFDLEEQTSESVSVTGQLDSSFISPFLPEGVSLTELEFEAAMNGPLEQPSHSGRVRFLELDSPTVKPLSG